MGDVLNRVGDNRDGIFVPDGIFVLLVDGGVEGRDIHVPNFFPLIFVHLGHKRTALVRPPKKASRGLSEGTVNWREFTKAITSGC